jgi:small conductance mechanosensitive channel
MDVNRVLEGALPLVLFFGAKVIGAIIIWIVGRRLIRLATTLTVRSLTHRLDPTVAGYLGTAASVILTVALGLALLGFFGVETTSFAALLAGAGVAIGVAWSGLLANLAAGVFLLVLRPFKAGDLVAAAGSIGSVEEIGLFTTTLTTPDNIRVYVGNNKILSDTIQNFSANAYRRVDLTAQLHHAVDHADAMGRLRQRVARVPNVLAKPVPDVAILSFTALGPVVAVRPYCSNEHYWQVYFDTNRVIRDTFGDAGYPAPEQLVLVRQQDGMRGGR